LHWIPESSHPIILFEHPPIGGEDIKKGNMHTIKYSVPFLGIHIAEGEEACKRRLSYIRHMKGLFIEVTRRRGFENGCIH